MWRGRPGPRNLARSKKAERNAAFTKNVDPTEGTESAFGMQRQKKGRPILTSRHLRR